MISWLNHTHPKNRVHEHIRHGIICGHETIWICHYKDPRPIPPSSRPLRGWILGIRIYPGGRFEYLKSTSKCPTTNGQRRPVILVLNTQLVVISLKWGSYRALVTLLVPGRCYTSGGWWVASGESKIEGGWRDWWWSWNPTNNTSAFKRSTSIKGGSPNATRSPCLMNTYTVVGW